MNKAKLRCFGPCQGAKANCPTPDACELPERLRESHLDRLIAGKVEPRSLTELLIAKGSMTGPHRAPRVPRARQRVGWAVALLVALFVSAWLGLWIAPIFAT